MCMCLCVTNSTRLNSTLITGADVHLTFYTYHVSCRTILILIIINHTDEHTEYTAVRLELEQIISTFHLILPHDSSDFVQQIKPAKTIRWYSNKNNVISLK